MKLIKVVAVSLLVIGCGTDGGPADPTGDAGRDAPMAGAAGAGGGWGGAAGGGGTLGQGGGGNTGAVGSGGVVGGSGGATGGGGGGLGGGGGAAGSTGTAGTAAAGSTGTAGTAAAGSTGTAGTAAAGSTGTAGTPAGGSTGMAGTSAAGSTGTAGTAAAGSTGAGGTGTAGSTGMAGAGAAGSTGTAGTGAAGGGDVSGGAGNGVGGGSGVSGGNGAAGGAGGGSGGEAGVSGGSGAGGVAGTGNAGGIGGTGNPDAGAGGDGAGGADGGGDDAPPPALCGDGTVSGSELCDTAIPAGSPGACPSGCPRTDLCVPRQLSGSGCARTCLDGARITAVAAAPDMCCAGANDVDCVAPYPVQASAGIAGTQRGSDQCTPPPNASYSYEAEIRIPMALGPTCGVPVLITVRGAWSPSNTIQTAETNISAVWPSAPSATDRDSLLPNTVAQGSMLVDAATDEPSFVTGQYYATKCNSGTLSATFDARPFTGLSVDSGGSPRRVRVGGDRVAQFLAIEDAPAGAPSAIRIVTGRYTPTRWVSLPPEIAPAAFTRQAAVTISPSGVAATEPTLAVEPTAPLADFTLQPYAHVAWIEDGGARLQYARVSAGGSVANASTIRSSAGITSPHIILIDPQLVALAWSEPIAGRRRIQMALISRATGAVASIADVTQGEGDAFEPALATTFESSLFNGGIVWIDTRSGTRAPWYRGLQAGGGLGAAAPVSTTAVDPADPTIQVVGNGRSRIAWTDLRDGHRAIYGKQQTSSTATWIDIADVRVSPVGEDAHHFRLPLPAPTIDTTGSPLTRRPENLSLPRVVWESGASGNRVRFGETNASLTGSPVLRSGPDGLRLSCASDTSSPDIAALIDGGRSYTGVFSTPAMTDSGLRLTVWIEGSAIMLQAANLTTVPRRPW